MRHYIILPKTQWKGGENMLKIDINEGEDLMHLEHYFKESSKMLIVQKSSVLEWKLFILKYWKMD